MTYKNKKNNTGFVALISAIIISAILLLATTNLSIREFYGRSNILDFELKEKSSALAEACIDTAILKLAKNPSYSPRDESISVDEDTCLIKSVTGNIINVRAAYKNYITNLEIEISKKDMSIINWIETEN